MSYIRRYPTYLAPTLATDATSPEIDITNYASGEIVIPTGSPITTLTYFVAAPPATRNADGTVKTPGTYVAAYDTTPSAITQTVSAAKAYPLPAALFGASVIQIQANSAGAVAIMLKS